MENNINNHQFISFKIIMYLFFMFFIVSCDKSLDIAEPFSYKSNSSKLENGCYTSTDCIGDKVCNFLKNRCVENPCNEQTCGENGVCNPHDKREDVGESFLQYSCDCNLGYKLSYESGKQKCVYSCEGVTCGSNFECVPSSGDIAEHCECKAGYKLVHSDENSEGICINACSDNDCTNFKNETKGDCIDSGYLEDGTKTFHKYCKCDNNYFEEKLNEDTDTDSYDLQCNSPCEDISCSEIIQGECNDDTEENCNNKDRCFWNNSLEKCLEKECNYNISQDCNDQDRCFWNSFINKCFEKSSFEKDCVCEETNSKSCRENSECFWNFNIDKCLKKECNNRESRGKCIAADLETSICSCDEGYQDQNNDLSCNQECTEDSCTSPNEFCGWRDGRNGNVLGLTSCICPEGYVQDDKEGCVWNKYAWTKTFGGGSIDKVTSMVIDSENNTFSVGFFRETIDFDSDYGVDDHISNGGFDIFIKKSKGSGISIWTKTIGGVGNDKAKAIAIDNNDNIYVVGNFSETVDFDPGKSVDNHTSSSDSDIFITKINKDGSYGWTKTIGGQYSITVNSISIHNINNIENNMDIFIIGSFEGSLDFNYEENNDYNNHDDEDIHNSNGRSDIFITKLKTNGDYIWTKTIGGIGSDEGSSIIVDDDDNNNIYLTGFFEGSLDFNYEDDEDIHDSNGDRDIFITKIDTEGVYYWTKTIGGIGNDKGTFITTYNQSILITGSFEGSLDFNYEDDVDIHDSNGDRDIFITKINRSGSYGWSKTIGGIGNDEGKSIAVGKSMNSENVYIYLTGSFKDSVNFNLNDTIYSDGGSDAFITKLNLENGEYIWPKTKTIGGVGNEDGVSIAIDKNDDILLTGNFNETVVFDKNDKITELSNGGSDIFIWKYIQENIRSCENIDCGNGECVIGINNNPKCICEDGYQDNNNDLFCVKSCKNSCIDETCDVDGCSCKIFNGSCNDSNGTAIYTCDIGYTLNGNFKCKRDNNSYSGSYEWTRRMGGIRNDEANAIAIDSFDNIYTVGYSENSDNKKEMFFSKISSSNDYGWSKNIEIIEDTDGDSIANSIIINNNNCDNCNDIYIIGENNHNAFLSKFGTDSIKDWVKTIAKGDSEENTATATAIIIDSMGNIYVAGTFRGSIDFNFTDAEIDNRTSKGESDIFLIKTDSDGNNIWTKTFGGIKEDQVTSLAIDSLDNIYITGSFSDTVDFNFDPSNADIHTSKGNSDIFLTQVSSNGDYNWTKTFGGTGEDKASFVTLYEDNIYITGYFYSDEINFNQNSEESIHHTIFGSTFLTKFAKNNNQYLYDWSKTIGGTNSDSFNKGKSIIVDDSGVYLSGVFSENSLDFDPENSDIHKNNGNSDIFLTRYNSNGDNQWTKTIGGRGKDISNALAIDSKNNIYLTGAFSNTVSFDANPGNEYPSNGELDIFIWKWFSSVCNNISCNTNEICEEQNQRSGCICKENYHLNGNDNCI